MKEFILYLLTFLIAYLFYVIFVLCRKNVLKNFPEGKEMRYLKYKYNIKINEKNLKSIANKIFLVNSFILATTVLIVTLFDNLILGLIVALIPLILMILIFYHFIGAYYRKKQGGK